MDEYKKLPLADLFEAVKKLPDWNRYAWPEVFYQHFGVTKPQPVTSVAEMVSYQPPPHQSLGDGKVEVRVAMEGGVRIIESYMELPVETTIEDEKVEEIKDENADDKKTDSAEMT